ncbi:DNA topoisomerase [Baffinella frigidus]|nr:DNA topoisomerase [Cryptophyta sp. CCMP2293]
MEVFIYERLTDKFIPHFVRGEEFEPTELRMTEGRTQPPGPLEEGDLIRMMSHYGIGTDATMAQHIKTVLERCYATKVNGLCFSPTALGTALVTGYEGIGADLARPAFRAKMEQDMNLIAAGQRNKNQVISDWMAAMIPIYDKVVRMQGRILEKMQPFFSRVNTNNWRMIRRGVSDCGHCPGKLDLKQQREVVNVANNGGNNGHGGNGNNNGPREPQRALVCSACDEPIMMPRGEITSYPLRCPICTFGVVSITSAEKQTVYQLCPWCSKNPPPEQLTVGNSFANGFKCFECSDPRCKIATGRPNLGTKIRPCFLGCGKMAVLKKSKKSYSLGCEGYPNCNATMWLPGGNDARIIPTEETCSLCQTDPPIKLMEFSFKRGSLPPHIPLRHKG